MRQATARRLAPLLALVLLAASPGAAGRQKRAGNRLLAEGRHEEALEAYRQGLSRAPEDAELHINAGAALYRLTRPHDAAEEFRRGMALASDAGLRRTALYNEGTSLLAAGDAAGAAGRFRQVLLEDPTDDAARRNFEIALARQEAEPQQEEKKSGPGEGGQGEQGERSDATPGPEPGPNPGAKSPEAPKGGGTEPPPTGGQGSAGEGAAPEGARPESSLQGGSRPLTAQEAERLLAAIGQGEKEDLRDALAELAARPRRNASPERDW